jgi:cytochrome c peroxidase
VRSREEGLFMKFIGLAAALAALTVTAPLAGAQNVSDKELAALKELYRRPAPQPIDNKEFVELGRELFFSPQLSASGNTACASCHFPQLGYGVTDAKSKNDAGKLTSRKSQPLIGIGYAGSAPVGWDGRSATLEDQAKASIATGSMSLQGTDKPVKVEAIVDRFKNDAAFVAKFEKAMPGATISIDALVKAVAAYERTLEPGTAPFDRWVAGDEQAISGSAKRGFALFNGKANCGPCHSGWRFTDDNFHDIGTTTTDEGRGRTVKDDPLMKFAFKTPTLRSVHVRPPYMHNASAPTLEDVIRHYEKGGIDRPSRSPLMMAFELTDQERQDLVAFLRTLDGQNATAQAQ